MDPYRAPAAPTRPCPRCEIGLGTRHVLDVVLDECSDCTGVFVPVELVPRLIDPLDLGLEVVNTFAPGQPTFEVAVRYLKCPRCAAMMNRRLLVKGSNVIVDLCQPHGVWFDAHELRRLAELGTEHDIQLRLDREPEPIESEKQVYARKQREAALVRTSPRDRGTLLASFIQALTGRFR